TGWSSGGTVAQFPAAVSIPPIAPIAPLPPRRAGLSAHGSSRLRDRVVPGSDTTNPPARPAARLPSHLHPEPILDPIPDPAEPVPERERVEPTVALPAHCSQHAGEVPKSLAILRPFRRRLHDLGRSLLGFPEDREPGIQQLDGERAPRVARLDLGGCAAGILLSQPEEAAADQVGPVL